MSKTTYTLLGFCAILIWSTSPAYAKVLSDGLGGFYAAAITNLIACSIVFLKQRFINGRVTTFKDAPSKFWIILGSLFVLFQALSFVSMAVIVDDEVVVTCILIRFLWPLFALLFMIPILHKHASKKLIFGVVISFIGIVLSQVANSSLSEFTSSLSYISNNRLAYILCLTLAVDWALFTNLSSKLTPPTGVDAMGIFMAMSAIVLFVLAIVAGEKPVFEQPLVWPMVYQGVVVGCVANVFWELSLVRGSAMDVILASNFLPPISAISTSIILGVGVPPMQYVGAFLVVLGTWWSKKCFKD